MLNVAETALHHKGKNGAARGKIIPVLNTKAPAEVTSEMMLMTPDEARRWRDQKHFERQRSLGTRNISRLHHEMKRGRFVAGTQIFICVLPNGAEVIINGNHTLEAICVSGIAQYLTITRHPVKDINEAGLLYATFDSQKKRSFVDAMKASGFQVEFRNVASFGSAINWILMGFTREGGSVQKSIPDLMEKIEDYKDVAESFGELMIGAPRECSKFLKRAPIMAVAFETLKYQPSLAQEFWGAIAKDDGLREGMPEHTFLRYMRSSIASHNRLYWARAAALAWNAKFKQRQLSAVRVETFRNFHLLGTPHDKGVIL